MTATDTQRDRNRATARRLHEEVSGQGKYELIPELLSENWTYSDRFGMATSAVDDSETSGRAGLRAALVQMRESFNDFNGEVLDTAVDGDHVWVRLRLTGTWTGPFLGCEPNGKSFAIESIEVHRFEGNKVIETGSHVDYLGWMTQLNILSAAK